MRDVSNSGKAIVLAWFTPISGSLVYEDNTIDSCSSTFKVQIFIATTPDVILRRLTLTNVTSTGGILDYNVVKGSLDQLTIERCTIAESSLVPAFVRLVNIGEHQLNMAQFRMVDNQMAGKSVF